METVRRIPLAKIILGLLILEVLSGFYIYLTAIDRPAALMVVLHAVLGLVLVGPRVRQLFAKSTNGADGRRDFDLYTSLFIWSGLSVIISGLAMTYQALLTPAVSTGLDVVHLLSVAAFMGFGVRQMVVRRKRTLVAA